MREFGVLEPTVIQAYTRQILRGLEFLHRNNFVVGGVTTDNILITNEGVAKLCDYWIDPSKRAVALGITGETRNGLIELLKQRDILSLAALVLAMATGDIRAGKAAAASPAALLQSAKYLAALENSALPPHGV